MIAWRATSLKAMFWAESFGVAAMTIELRTRCGIRERPLQRLHRAQAAAHHRGEALDAEVVGKPRLRGDPVLDRDHRESPHPRACRSPGLTEVGPVEPKHEPM